MIYGTRAHWNTWGRVSQAQNQVQKWNNDLSNFWYKWLISVDAGRNIDKPLAVHLHMHSGFPTKMMEQTIMTS